MVPTRCAICGTYDNAVVVYKAQLERELINEKTYSARRYNSRINHFRMVRCNVCGLLRSDPILNYDTVSMLYEKSMFTYESHISNLSSTYTKYIKRALKRIQNPTSFLDIGCGNGFMLKEALRIGFTNVFGIEPSSDAIAKADPNVRSIIRHANLEKNIFPDASFDMITMFQTLDHLPDPVDSLTTCFRMLKPGGVMLSINHNEKSIQRFTLGEKSPIIDIEHTYLYNRKTEHMLFQKIGFTDVKVGMAMNKHNINYLTSLLPLSTHLKRILIQIINVIGIGQFAIWLPLGNIYTIATKPKNE